jgi:NHLM bacteriocin system ABC transporter ATP-binding protein
VPTGWLEVFAAEGAAREVAGNSPLPLDDPAGVWLVVAGAVDVFAVPLRAGRPAGPRVHLLRVEAGGLLLGAAAGPAEQPGLLAVGLAGSRVARLEWARVLELAGEPGRAAGLAGLVDGWAAGLTAGVATARPPRKALHLEPDKELSPGEGGIVVPGRSAVWVCHRAGGSRFLGKVPLEGPGPFPLAGPAWLEVRGPAVLAGVATEAVLGGPAREAGLERFHRVVLACAALNAQEAASAEHQRLRRRSESDSQLLRDSLVRLREVVTRKGDDVAPAGPAEDPLVAACRVVGERLGIAVAAPRKSGDRKQGGDPVQAVARASRFRVRRVLLAGDWWRQDNGPLLAFRAEDGRPVALLPAGPGCEVVDPGAGTRAPVTPAGASALKVFAYTFYRPFPAGALTARHLLRFGMAGGRRDWLVVVLLGLAGSLLSLVTPVATGWVFDRVIPAGDHRNLALVVLALAAAAVATALFQVTEGIAALRVETAAEGTVEAALWDRLLDLPAPFFRRYAAGDLAVRALGIGAIRQALTDVALSSVLTFVFSAVSLGLLFWYSTRLALLTCLLLLLLLGIIGASALGQLRYQRGAYEARGRIAGLVLQLLGGITRLRVAGAEDRALAVWARAFGVQKRLAFRARSRANNLAAVTATVPLATSMLLFAAVSYFPGISLSLGGLLAFSVAAAQVFTGALIVSSSLGSLVQVVPFYEGARPILETPPEVEPTRADPGELSGEIEISHVSFRYQADGPLVLDDVSVHVRPGEFVAFVGPSGAGKSTILRLLLGLEKPTSGSVFFDREDLTRLDPRAVRRQMGVVLQTSKILAGDVQGNIVGSSLLTLEDAWEAARLAALDEDLRQMPMGMHTVLTEGGTTLSGGQRQRLLIARALASKPRILLFDEATSALDNATQAQISRSLERLKATRVVIAHRLSTIRNADCIYVLDAGRVVQRGRYEELLAQGGMFGELARRQLL